MEVGTELVAHCQAAEAAKPGKGPLHNPAMAAQSLGRFDAALATVSRVAADETPQLCPAGGVISSLPFSVDSTQLGAAMTDSA